MKTIYISICIYNLVVYIECANNFTVSICLGLSYI